MKTTTTGSQTATIELTRDEVALIIYAYETHQGSFNKKERELFESFRALIKRMDYLKKVEASITAVFNSK